VTVQRTACRPTFAGVKFGAAAVVLLNSAVEVLPSGLVHCQLYVGLPVPPVTFTPRVCWLRVEVLDRPVIEALSAVPTVFACVLLAVNGVPALSVTVHVTE
jgi:hypothetical protein